MAKAKSQKLHKLYTRKQIDALRFSLICQYGDQCAICKKPRSAFKNRLSVDHNHSSGKIRGLLCYYCNRRLVGKLSIESARKILAYLLMYDTEETRNE
jgi:hypothetical protein